MPKKLFLDIANEMEGQCISDVFEVSGHRYEMKLLNGAEVDWRNKYVVLNAQSLDKAAISLAVINSMKRPTLAVGIRSIDGSPLAEQFADDWESLDAKVRGEMLGADPEAKKWFVSECFLGYLRKWSDTITEELWAKWADLTARREEAKDAVKKSSGESSEPAEKQNSTELSPSGDQ